MPDIPPDHATAYLTDGFVAHEHAWMHAGNIQYLYIMIYADIVIRFIFRIVFIPNNFSHFDHLIV